MTRSVSILITAGRDCAARNACEPRNRANAGRNARNRIIASAYLSIESAIRIAFRRASAYNAARVRFSAGGFREDLAQSFAGSREVREPHLHVLTRQHDAVGSSFECGANRAAHIVRFGPLVRESGRDVDIDSRINLDLPRDTGNGALRLPGDVIGRQAGGVQFLVRALLVIHDLVEERQEIFGTGVMEEGRTEPVQVGRHARTARIVVGGDLQIVRVVFGARIVLLGAVKRAERHVLHDVKSERLLGGDRLRRAVQFRADRMITVGPQLLPAQDLGIIEQQPPERYEITVGRPLVFRGGTEQLVERAVAGLRALYRDAAFPRFCAAMFAETSDALAGPTTTDRVLERPHPLAAPSDPVHLARVAAEIALDFPDEMAAVVWVIEARVDSAPAIDVYLRDLRRVRNVTDHPSALVVIVPAEEIHSAGFDLGSDFGDDVEFAVIRRTEFVQDGIAEILRVVVIECTAGERGIPVPTMVGQRDGAVRRIARAHYIVIGVGPHRVDVALLLQIIEDLIDSLVDPGMRLHLNGDEVPAVFDGRRRALRSGFRPRSRSRREVSGTG